MGFFKRKKADEVRGLEVNEGWPDDAPDGFVVFDIETTGLSPAGDRIIELGLVRTDFSGTPMGYWSTLVNPNRPITATEIHGIKDSDVLNAPTFDECADEFLKRIKNQVLVAHNASFDHSFVRAELARAGWDLPEIPVVCTMLESKHFLPGLTRKRLIDCVEALGIEQAVQHRALGDASLTSAVFHFYLNGPVNQVRASELQGLIPRANSLLWPTEKTFPSIQPAKSGSAQWRKSPPQKTTSSLLQNVSELMPEDLLSDEASSTEISYGLLLLETLSDGEISDLEIESLRDFAQSMALDEQTVNRIHNQLLLALSREAWRDGVVNRAEQKDIISCAQQLGLSETDGKNALREIEEFRAARVAARTKPIPEVWNLGEPIRVGDRVVITGCYEVGRYEMEQKARSLGVRITGSVSGKTTLLVSDGTINGNKEADAQRLGIKIVDPSEFKELLEYVQPQTQTENPPNRVAKTKEATSQTANEVEHLVCTKCAQTFERQVTKGRKPHLCPPCKG